MNFAVTMGGEEKPLARVRTRLRAGKRGSATLLNKSETNVEVGSLTERREKSRLRLGTVLGLEEKGGSVGCAENRVTTRDDDLPLEHFAGAMSSKRRQQSVFSSTPHTTCTANEGIGFLSSSRAKETWDGTTREVQQPEQHQGRSTEVRKGRREEVMMKHPRVRRVFPCIPPAQPFTAIARCHRTLRKCLYELLIPPKPFPT